MRDNTTEEHAAKSGMRTGRPEQCSPGVLVIGVGNEFRTDDALGIVVARELQGTASADVKIVEASGEGASLMEAWKGARSVIIVDAVRSGAPPGSLHHVDLSRKNLPGRLLPRSSHLFGVAEAVATARVLGQLPPRVLLIGVESESFDFGTKLTDSVLQTLPALLKDITREVKRGETA